MKSLDHPEGDAKSSNPTRLACNNYTNVEEVADVGKASNYAEQSVLPQSNRSLHEASNRPTKLIPQVNTRHLNRWERTRRRVPLNSEIASKNPKSFILLQEEEVTSYWHYNQMDLTLSNSIQRLALHVNDSPRNVATMNVEHRRLKIRSMIEQAIEVTMKMPTRIQSSTMHLKSRDTDSRNVAINGVVRESIHISVICCLEYYILNHELELSMKSVVLWRRLWTYKVPQTHQCFRLKLQCKNEFGSDAYIVPTTFSEWNADKDCRSRRFIPRASNKVHINQSWRRGGEGTLKGNDKNMKVLGFLIQGVPNCARSLPQIVFTSFITMCSDHLSHQFHSSPTGIE